MTFQITILTCDGREDQLAKTLSSLKRTDWPTEPRVVRDTTRHADRRVSQVTTARQILRAAEALPWDFLVFCEDDVLFNKHLHHNLTRWQPVKDGTLRVGTLYDSTDRPDSHPHKIGGSQGIVIGRPHLPDLIRHWEGYGYGPHVMQDMRIYQSSPVPIPIHQPNLVQHRECPSTWGGAAHHSPTFAENWRAAD